eukprot:TRINITY_DN49834_c0_g1_i1.p1 TRINITY_DN49834_c0_g1~~TRINITY_DN49834_c0_g1_i1.p1  ORF type:complete len:174 (-),score=34.99 TRINITY_DN49834_c0_g1_i1:495-1016(-)
MPFAAKIARSALSAAATVVSGSFRRAPGGVATVFSIASRRHVSQLRIGFGILAVPSVQKVVIPSCDGPRRFSLDSPPSVEQRVIAAVKRYAAMRVEELKREATASDERDKMIQAFSGEVSPSTTWDELGFDELDKVEVLLEVEEEFSHIIPDDTADAIQSVEGTITYIKEHAS